MLPAILAFRMVLTEHYTDFTGPHVVLEFGMNKVLTSSAESSLVFKFISCFLLRQVNGDTHRHEIGSKFI